MCLEKHNHRKRGFSHTKRSQSWSRAQTITSCGGGSALPFGSFPALGRFWSTAALPAEPAQTAPPAAAQESEDPCDEWLTGRGETRHNGTEENRVTGTGRPWRGAYRALDLSLSQWPPVLTTASADGTKPVGMDRDKRASSLRCIIPRHDLWRYCSGIVGSERRWIRIPALTFMRTTQMFCVVPLYIRFAMRLLVITLEKRRMGLAFSL